MYLFLKTKKQDSLLLLLAMSLLIIILLLANEMRFYCLCDSIRMRQRVSHLTLFSFFVLCSTSCCREENVSLISKVSSSCNIISCWISLSRLICKITQNIQVTPISKQYSCVGSDSPTITICNTKVCFKTKKRNIFVPVLQFLVSSAPAFFAVH